MCCQQSDHLEFFISVSDLSSYFFTVNNWLLSWMELTEKLQKLFPLKLVETDFKKHTRFSWYIWFIHLLLIKNYIPTYMSKAYTIFSSLAKKILGLSYYIKKRTKHENKVQAGVLHFLFHNDRWDEYFVRDFVYLSIIYCIPHVLRNSNKGFDVQASHVYYWNKIRWTRVC